MKPYNYRPGFHSPSDKTFKGFWFDKPGRDLKEFSQVTDEIERLAFISNKQADKTTFEPEDFRSMDISGIWNSNFSGARFNKCGFLYPSGCYLEDDYHEDPKNCFTSINFRKTEFSNCSFNSGFLDCNFSECVFKEGCVFEGDFTGCNFSDSSFGVDTLFIFNSFGHKTILDGINWRSINCESVTFEEDEDFFEALEGGAYFGDTLEERLGVFLSS